MSVNILHTMVMSISDVYKILCLLLYTHVKSFKVNAILTINYVL